MDSQTSSVKISIGQGQIEIVGSENFVSTQLDNLKDVIATLTQPQVQTVGSKKLLHGNNASDDGQTNSDNDHEFFKKHADVYHLDGEKIELVIEEMPGIDDPSKVANAALLIGMANKQNGKDESNVEDIRSICELYGCLNKTNFSTHIKKGAPHLYLDKGEGKARIIKLTKAGEKKALELIKQIKSDVASEG